MILVFPGLVIQHSDVLQHTEDKGKNWGQRLKLWLYMESKMEN